MSMRMDQYEYGVDQLLIPSRTITPYTEAEAEEVYQKALASKPLPTGYLVRAVIACNQVDAFRLVQCDYTITTEARRESIQSISRRILAAHYRYAHPSMDEDRIRLLVSVIQFNFRDFGR